MTRSLAILGLTFTVLGCTATQPVGTTPGLPPSPSSAQSAPTAAGYRNLQVLPRDISREQLLATMRTFTRGLDVRCNFCHVVTATTPEEKLDFPSDAKEEKRVARVMIQMTNQINAEWLERVEQAEGEEHKQGEAASGHRPLQARSSAPGNRCGSAAGPATADTKSRNCRHPLRRARRHNRQWSGGLEPSGTPGHLWPLPHGAGLTPPERLGGLKPTAPHSVSVG